MLADLPQMTWFEEINMLFYHLVDKVDGSDVRPDRSRLVSSVFSSVGAS